MHNQEQPLIFGRFAPRFIIALALVFTSVSCSRLDKDSNCLNDQSSCFKADKTAPTFVASTPAPSEVVSRLTTLTVVFSEELKDPRPADVKIDGGGKGQLTLASITKIAANTYTLSFSPDTVSTGPILIDFTDLVDYNNNKVNYSLALTGNVDIEIKFDDNSTGTNTGFRKGVSHGGGYTTTDIKWRHEYGTDPNNNWDMRVTTGAVDCTAGTSIFTGTGLPHLTDVTRTLDRVTHFTSGARTYRVVVCITNAVMNKKGTGSVEIIRDDTPPMATHLPVSDDYNSTKSMTVACSDNMDKVAVVVGQLSPWDGNLANPANPADPDFNASGDVSVGALLSGSYAITNATNPTRTKVRYRCIDIAGNKSAVSQATYLIDTTLPEVTVNLDSSFRQFVSVTGYTTTTVNFTTNQSGTQYRIVKNATSCAALDGTSVIGAGPFTTPPAGPHVINASALDVGVNNLRVCVSNVGATKWAAASLQITRDDTVPIITPSVTTGTYGAVQVVNLTCAPNPDKVAITDAVLAGSAAPTPPSDPNIDANGNILFGVQRDQFTTPDASVSTIKWQCISKSGNRSVVNGTTTATYTVDSILPTVTIFPGTRVFVSNLVGAYNFTDLTFQVSRPGLTYSIKSGSTNCVGGTTLASGTVAAAGQNITERLNTPFAGPPTHFSAVGSYDLKICVPNLIGNLGYSTTSLVVEREDTRPNDVAGLTVTGGNATSVALSWTATTDNGAAGIGGYRIYQSTTPGDFTSATEYTSLTNSVNISGLSASTTYYFVVKALDNAGNLSLNYSNEVQSKFTLSVSLSGYGSAGDGPFRAQLGSGEILSFTANGTQSFSQVFIAGDTYSVTIVSQPAGRNCAFTVNQYGTLTAPLALQARCTNGVLHSGALNGNKAATLGFHLYRGNATILAGVGGGAVCPGSNNALCRDGVGLQGQFNNPHGMTIAKEVLYIADRENNRIRAFDLNTSTTSTFAGEGAAGSTDGIGTGARLNKPQAVTTDGVNLYVAESPNAPDAAYIRRIDILTQQVTTIAGGATVAGGTACPGVAQANCRDGTGGQALFGAPNDIKYHDGSLYISEYGNNRVRRLQLATGQVTTIAGDGNATSLNNATGTSASFNGATGLTIVGNTLYVVDFNGHRIRSISLTAPHAVATIAGSGTAGHADGPSSNARFNNPDHIFSDARDLYVTEYVGNRVRRINLQANVVSTIAGNGTGADTAGTGASASLNGPVGIVSDGYRFYAITFTGGQLFRITNSGLVGHWPLAGDASDYASDVTSASNGTTNGAPSTIATDRFGSSGGYAFDGVDDYLSMSGTNLPIGNAARTVCAWVRIEDGTNTGNDGIVTYGQRGPNTVFGLRMSNPSQVSSWSASSDVNFNLPLPVTNWTHTCVTHNGSVTQVFQNGRILNSSAASYNTQPGSLCIGERSATGGGAACDTPNNHFFKGSIAEVRIYNRALNEGEINELAQDAAPAQVGGSYNTAATGLLSHYEFSSGAATAPAGPAGGTLVPSGAPTAVVGKDGDTNGASNFSGSPDKYTGSEIGLPMLDHPRTACAWVKPAYYPTSGGFFSILSYGNPASTQMFSLVIREVSGAQHVSMLNFGLPLTRPFALPLQTWSHVCGTHNGTGGSIYVNGALLGAADQALTIATTATNGLIIGSSSSLGTSHFPGAIDDVRVYNNVLTQQQIRQLATQVPSGLVARYALDGDGSDSSGWANNASAQTGSATQDRFAMNTTALSYARASSQRTQIPHALSLNPQGSVTVAAWVRPTTLPATGEVMFIVAKDIFGASGYGLELYNGAGVQSIVWLTPGTTGAHYSYTLPVGVYSHVAVTQTGPTATLYVNGAPITASTYAVAPMTPTTTADFVIGGDALNATGYFNGAIDDVRLYSRALSQNEVRALVTQPNKKIQISATMNTGVHDGGGGIAAADALCTSAGTNFKALIVDNSVRRACTSPGCGTSGIAEQIDWVLRPNITYLRADALTPIVTADFTGLLPTPLLNMVTGAGDQAWTGLNADWTVSLHTCNSWTTTSNQGQYGVGNATGGQAYSANNASCSSTLHVYCVEQ